MRPKRRETGQTVQKKIYFRLQLRGFLSFSLQNVLTLKQAV
jgi:hypothetical protein